jgi:hypothetical protein
MFLLEPLYFQVVAAQVINTLSLLSDQIQIILAFAPITAYLDVVNL